jgi:hypothetical protein
MRQSSRANDGVRHRQLERYRPQTVNFAKEIELMEISMLSNRASRRAIHNSEDVQREHDGRPHSLQTSKKELDKKLDKALDESFPSSDPPAVTQPSNNEPAGDPKVEP